MKCVHGRRRNGAPAVPPLLLLLGLVRCAGAQITLASAPSPAGPPTGFGVVGPGGFPPQQVPVSIAVPEPRPLPQAPPVTPPHTLLGVPQPRGTVTMRSLRLASREPNQEAKIYIGAKSEFAMGTDAAGNFLIEKAGQPEPMVELDTSDVLHLNAAKVQAASIDVNSHIALRGVRQWELAAAEDFGSVAAGWTRSEVTQCAGIFMLGGFCKFSHGEVNKTFSGLPPHSHLRVKATYHFIDRWIGESGYLKLNIGQGRAPVIVWSEQHAQEQSRNGVSICGNGETPEGKFAVSIDVTVPHREGSVQLSFGSTMADSDPCDESWGVSGVELHTRM